MTIDSAPTFDVKVKMPTVNLLPNPCEKLSGQADLHMTNKRRHSFLNEIKPRCLANRPISTNMLRNRVIPHGESIIRTSPVVVLYTSRSCRMDPQEHMQDLGFTWGNAILCVHFASP